MANNCSSLTSWAFLPDPMGHTPKPSPWALGSWLSDAAVFENEALTSALRASISSSSSPTPSTSTTSAASEPTQPKPKPISSPIPAHAQAQTRPTGRIAKRKQRASRRTPTTYISADPANFRRMVQEVTGIRVAGGVAAEPTARPAASRSGIGYVLPTLDTSAFLLDRLPAAVTTPEEEKSTSGSMGMAAAVATAADVESSSSLFELEEMVKVLPMSNFPTLESWGMI